MFYLFIVLGIIYIVSVVFSWLYVRRSKMPGGIYESLNFDGFDVLVVCMPMINTWFALDCYFDPPIKYNKSKKPKNMNWFFLVK